MTDDTPQRIGPYDVVATIGKGSMGAVYKAIQPSLNRSVAVKVLPAKFRSDANRVERFHREAQTVAMLNHPNIVQIIDKGQDGETLYFVMEFVEGTSLDAILRQRRLSLQEALKVMHAICLGLQAAHDAGVVHRDLNPRNILVNPSLSIVKVADFGISRVESVSRSLGTLTSRDMSLGSIHYLAPEQAMDPTNVDHRADIYSAGAVFYEMLTGRVPLGKFSLPSELNSELPSEIDPIVLKCLSDEPDKRYPTITKLQEDVDRLEERMRFQLVDELRGIHRSTAKFFDRSSKSFGRGAWGLWLIGAAVVALAAGAIYLFAYRTSPGAPAAKPAEAPPAKSAPAEPASKPAEPASKAPSTTAPPATPPATTLASPPATTASVPAKPAEAKTPATPAKPPVEKTEPKATAKANAAAAKKDLDVARSKIDAKLYDQALSDLKTIIDKNPDAEVAIEAHYLVAKALFAKGQPKDALAKYVEIETRYKGMPASAEAWYDHAHLVQGTGSDKAAAEEARGIYGQLADAFPQSPWTVKGLVAKSELEKRFKVSQRDPRLGTSVPSALISLRELSETHPTDLAAESAFWQLGQMYDDMKRYDLAAAAYVALGTNFPATRLDAWYEAAQLFEKRLKDPAKAKTAYLKVPSTSQNYKDAQKRAEKIKG